jgi:aspartyl-tRNA(Asn)/glutamyl-tRNA(Gln) amidotransferase subunit A
MSGCPALIVPCGFDHAGMPISMQVVAPAFDEATAFRLGHAYTQATDWVRRPAHLMKVAA